MDDKYCECELAGFCKKHNARKTARDVELCQGLNCSASECLKTRALWESRNSGVPTEVARRQIRGIGDVISMATTAVGITPCGGCKGRAATLNHYVPLQSAPEPLRTPIDRSRLVKHFIFHMLPLANEHEWVWRKAVARIRKNLHRFNGKVVIAIATYPLSTQEVKKYGTKMTLHLSSYNSVVEAFGSDAGRVEFVSVVNSIRGEGVSFPGMLERVLADDPNHVICYAHNKGGTHGEMAINTAPHVWREAMWETVVENDEAISALERGALAGSFVRHGGTGTRGKWHYAGTFFWMRSADVIARNWAYIQKHYGCVEMWPAVHFQQHEVECLFSNNVGEVNDTNYWERTLIPSLQKWRDARYQITDESPSLSIVIPTISRPTLDDTLKSIASQKMGGRDEVIVVVDGDDVSFASERLARHRLRGTVASTGRRSNDWGAAARMLGQSLATGDVTLFMDDDDCYSPGAFTAVRYHATRHPGKALLFRMTRKDGSVVWSDPQVRQGNVSTQCVAVPRSAPTCRWGGRYEGDFDFISQLSQVVPIEFIAESICDYGR